MLMLTGCEEDKGYYLAGEIEGMEDGKKVLIAEIDSQTRAPKVIDTAIVQDERFEIDLEEREVPNLSFLNIEGTNGNVVFISENQRIDFKINKDSIMDTQVMGGRENKALSEYMDHLKELNQKLMPLQKEMTIAVRERNTEKIKELQEAELEIKENDKNVKEEFFNRYTDSFLSIMLLNDMANLKMHSAAEIREMYEKIPEYLKNTPLAETLETNLERLSIAEVGTKAPEFSAPTPEGEELSLSENLGKVTIVDFWAAWCKPCRVENPNLVRTYNKYKDQGLNIISVSLDRPGQKDKWVEAIKEDNLGQWDHVSNLQFWNDPIVSKYGINAIPATFILDENGVIVAKNLRGEELTNKIGELLN